MRTWILAAALPLVALSACSSSSAGSGSSASTQPDTPQAGASPASPVMHGRVAHFHSTAYGFRIDYPADMAMHRDFRHGYLANDAWKVGAGPDSHGSPIMALTLDGSDRVTAGELRIGASRDPRAVERCLQLPDSARGPAGTREVNGTSFTYFESGDAAMNHYLHTHSYRLVHDGACIAIDLIVYGTNPQVYDPPATPPFTQQAAFERLQQALQGFRFTL